MAFLYLSANAFGQQIDITGYYEPQYLGANPAGEYFQMISNKLRIDFQSNLDSDIKFGANFDFITYHGKTNWYIPDYLPKLISDSIDSLTAVNLYFDYRDTLFLDNAFVKIPIGPADFTLGKQQISLGTGYVWNPTDLFNYKSVVDPTYEQPGHNAVRLDLALPYRYNASFIFQSGETAENSTKLATFGGHLGHFDYSAIFIEKYSELSDYQTFEILRPRRRMYGGDLVGQILGLGVWAEAGYNTLHNNPDFWDADFGTDYTLDNGLYILVEYYRDGRGKQNSDRYDLADWMNYISGVSKAISRDNLYLYGDYPATDFIHVNNSVITSISDASIALTPGLVYSMRENLELTVFLSFNTGKPGTAYASELGNSGLARFRYYF